MTNRQQLTDGTRTYTIVWSNLTHQVIVGVDQRPKIILNGDERYRPVGLRLPDSVVFGRVEIGRRVYVDGKPCLKVSRHQVFDGKELRTISLEKVVEVYDDE